MKLCLDKLADELKEYGRGGVNLVKELITTLKVLKMNKITPPLLSALSERIEKSGDKRLGAKLHDLGLIFKEYQSRLEEGFAEVGLNGKYGFPSQIEDDPIFNFVRSKDESFDFSEERRLFYVALTRTKNRVFIIAPEKHPSEFVLELKAEYKNIVLKGEFNPEPHGLLTNKVCPICGYPLQRRHRKDCAMNLWVCTNEPEVCGFVSNNLVGGKMYIQKCTECVDGYLIVKTKDGHSFLGCTNYTHDGKGCNNTISPQDFDESVKDNEIIEIEVIDDNQERKEEPVIETVPKMEEKDIPQDNLFNKFVNWFRLGN